MDQSWLNIKDKGIEESVSLVIVGVVLVVECQFDLEHVGLRVFRNNTSDCGGVNLLSFDLYSVFRVSKSHVEIFAFRVWTFKVLACDIHTFIQRILDRTKFRINRQD